MQKVNFDSCAGKLHKIICKIFHRKNLFTCFREFVYNILLKAVAEWLKCNEENIPNACIAKVNARVGVPLPPKPAQAQRERNAFKVVHGNNLVSLEVFSQHKSWWSCRQLLYVTVFFFSSFSVFIQYRISKSVVICSFCSFLFFSPLFTILLFSILLSICYSMFCFFSRCLFALFSDLPYCFLFKSVILSFLFPITLFCLLLPYALFLLNLFSFY